MGKVKARISRSKAHKRAVVKGHNYANCYTIEIPDEPELRAFIRFIYFYLRLQDRIEDSGLHPGYVTTKPVIRNDYPTESQTTVYSLLREIGEHIDCWLRERV